MTGMYDAVFCPTALEQLSVGELDAMLDQQLRGESVDGDAVRAILDVLRKKEKGYPVEMSQELRQAWEQYRQGISEPSEEDGD